MSAPPSPPPQGPYGSQPPYAPPPQQPYPQGYPQAYAPPPKKDNTVLIVVVVLVVIVGLVAAIAAWWFFMVIPAVTNPPAGTKPLVIFSNPTLSGNVATMTVAAAYPAASYQSFKVNMRINATTGPTAMAMGSSGTGVTMTMSMGMSMMTFTMVWTDNDSGGTMTSGDRITVTAPGGFAPSTTYTFLLLWSDGTEITAGVWAT